MNRMTTTREPLFVKPIRNNVTTPPYYIYNRGEGRPFNRPDGQSPFKGSKGDNSGIYCEIRFISCGTNFAQIHFSENSRGLKFAHLSFVYFKLFWLILGLNFCGGVEFAQTPVLKHREHYITANVSDLTILTRYNLKQFMSFKMIALFITESSFAFLLLIFQS